MFILRFPIFVFGFFILEKVFLAGTNSGTNLCLKIWVNSKEFNTFNASPLENISISVPYNEGQHIKLACISMPLLGEIETVHWKLEQNNIELLVTKNQSISLKSQYDIQISPDRYDNNIVAKCEASGTKKIVKVRFNMEAIEYGYEINEEEINYSEGQPVFNILDRHVIVYKNDSSVEKFVKPKSNIYDQLREDKNQTIYAAWFESSSDIKQDRMIVDLKKKYWKIIVQPTDETSEKSFPIVAVVTGAISIIFFATFAFWIHRIYVKRRQRNENSEHICPQVAYATINLKTVNRPLPPIPQEPYATIIGVVKPRKKSNAVKTPPTKVHLEEIDGKWS